MFSKLSIKILQNVFEIIFQELKNRKQSDDVFDKSMTSYKDNGRLMSYQDNEKMTSLASDSTSFQKIPMSWTDYEHNHVSSKMIQKTFSLIKVVTYVN